MSNPKSLSFPSGCPRNQQYRRCRLSFTIATTFHSQQTENIMFPTTSQVEEDKTIAVKFSRLGSPKHYEYACEMLHKMSKFKSLSSAQSYLILIMPHDRSFVFHSFLRFVFLVFHWFV